MQSYILLIDGQDETGLIHRITGIILQHGLNIIQNSEFVDPETNRFFMRSEFTGTADLNNLLENLHNSLPKGFQIKLQNHVKKKIVVMVSKEHHCLADLLIRHKFGKLNATIMAVIGNHPDLQSLVEMFQIPFHYVSHQNQTRSEHEQKIESFLEKYTPDYIVLAKYMRILTPEFVQNHQFRLVNIHHSFLPAFIGANPYEQAYRRGVKIIGATAHFVNENLDEGPIIVQEVIQIDHKFTAADMQSVGQDAEMLALAKALKFIFEDRVFINRNKTVIFS
jgi:formyltetrahydrofolate deformylase